MGSKQGMIRAMHGALGFILFWMTSMIVQAQIDPTTTLDYVDPRTVTVEHPGLHPDCARIDQLITLNQVESALTPTNLIDGGAVVVPDQPYSSAIFERDAGDRWVFGVTAREQSSNNPGVNITLDTTTELLLQVYQGMERVDRVRIDPGTRTINYLPEIPGFYTAVVTRTNALDFNTSGTYTITFSGDISRPIFPGEEVSGAVGPAVRFQQWTFFQRMKSNQRVANLDFNLGSTAGARLRVFFNGQLLENLSLDVATGTRRGTLPLTQTGYYTLVIAPADNTQTSNYTLRLNPPADRNEITAALFDGIWQPRWEGGAQAITLRPEPNILHFMAGTARVSFAPDTANILVPSEASNVRVEFLTPRAERGARPNSFNFLNQGIRSVELLDGNLSVITQDDLIFYVQDYPWQVQFQDSTNFRSIGLPDGRTISNTNRTIVQTVWVFPNCIGIGMTEGRRFIAQGRILDFGLQPGDGGPDRPLTQQIIQAFGPDGEYRFRINWQDIQSVYASDGIVTLRLTDERLIQLDRTNINIERSTSGFFQISENVGTGGAQTTRPVVVTDWDNLLRFISIDDRTIIDVLDGRGRIERTRDRVARFTSEGRIIRLEWEPGYDSLLLPREYDFIQLESPRTPTSYNPLAQVGEPGYEPRGYNNVGQELYTPINTAFEFNFARNGEANPANGNLSLSVTDLFAEGYRIDLTLSRTYNSRNHRNDGPFGYGWDTDFWLDYNAIFNDDSLNRRTRAVTRGVSYEIGLNLLNASRGQVIFKTATGTRYLFELVGTPPNRAWRALDAPGWQIEPRANALTSPWRIVRPDGLIYEFDLAGRLRRIEHPHGGHLTVTRTSEVPVIYVVRDDVGRELQLEYDDAYHIVRSTLVYAGDVLGETRYRYRDGYLVEVQYDDGTRALYGYNNEGQLITHEDPRMPRSTRMAYNYDPQLRLRFIAFEQDERENFIRFYRYQLDEGQGIASTTTTDEYGRAMRHDFIVVPDPNRAYKLIRIAEPDGTEVTYDYTDNINSRLITNRNRQGVRYVLNYHQGVTLSSLVHPQAWIDFGSTYQDVTVGGNRLYALLRYRENGTSGPLAYGYTYDDQGRLIGVTDSDDRTQATVLTVNAFDDRFGLPTELMVSYPPLVTLTGNPDADPPADGQTILITYDDLGYPATYTDGTGIAQFRWDATGRLTGYRWSRGDTPLQTYRLSYERNSNGQVISITDQLGTVTTRAYDARMRLVTQTMTDVNDELLERFRYGYDDLDRLIAVRQSVSDAIAEDIVTTYAYTIAPSPAVWRRTTTHPDGTITLEDYDSQDRVIRRRDALGLQTTFAYVDNDRGTIITERAPNGIETTYTYSLSGQLCSVRYPTTEWLVVYGGRSCNSPQRETTRISIDQRLSIDYANYYETGAIQQFSLIVNIPNASNTNQFSSRTGARDNPVWRYEFDRRGRVARIWNVAQGDERRYAYSDADGLTTIVETRTNFIVIPNTSQFTRTEYDTITYRYDALQRLVSVETPEGTIAYTYTDLPDSGLIETQVVATGRGAEPIIWAEYHDSLGRLRQWVGPDGTTSTYTYDAAGRLLEERRGDILVAAYIYDGMNRVIQHTDERGRIHTWRYDALGLLIETNDFDDVVLRYSYDAQGNLVAVTDALGRTTTYLYDNLGQIIRIITPEGRAIAYTWENATGTLRAQDGTASTSYHFDFLNRLRQINDTSGRRHLFDYNALGHLTSYDLADVAQIAGFGYGAGTDLTQITANGVGWAFRSDSMGRLTQRTDPDSGSLSLGYDMAGRLATASVPPTFTRRYDYSQPGIVLRTTASDQVQMAYDVLYRLVRWQAGDGENTAVTTFSYEEDDVRIVRYDGIQIDQASAPRAGNDLVFTYRLQDAPDEAYTGQRYRFNLAGELIAVEQIDGLADAECPNQPCVYTRAEHLRYDNAGRPIAHVSPEGHITTYGYDQRGRLTSALDALGYAYRYSYDDLNRLVRIENPAGTVLDLTYDVRNRLIGVRLNGAPLETYTYNAQDRLTERRFPFFNEGLGRQTFAYSPAGRLTTWGVDSRQVATLSRTADGLARILNIAGEEGLALEYRYSLAGQLISAVSGGLVSEFAYDPAGTLQSIVLTERGQTETWAYDYAYDSAARTWRLTYGNDGDVRLRWLYDEGLALRRLAADTTLEIAYELTDAGHLRAHITNAQGNTSQVIYDEGGNTIGYIYLSDSGPVQTRIERNAYGLPDAFITLNARQAFTYGPTLRLTAQRAYTTPGADLGGVLYIHDASGRLIQVVTEGQLDTHEALRLVYTSPDPSLLTAIETAPLPLRLELQSALVLMGLLLWRMWRRRGWVALFVVLIVLLPVVLAQDIAPATTDTIQYIYDGAGNVREIRTPAGPITISHDALGRLKQLSDGQGNGLSLTYDGLGRLASLAGGGARLNYRYDGSALVAVLSDGISLYPGLPALPDGLLSTDGLPLSQHGLPGWQGMIALSPFNLYVTTEGRAYDPRSGRYLQRASYPSLDGFLYELTPERAVPIAPNNQPDPERAPLQALLAARQQARPLTSADVLQRHQPAISGQYIHPGMEALRQANQAIQDQQSLLADFPLWLAYDYNPPGVVADSVGRFRLLDKLNPDYRAQPAPVSLSLPSMQPARPNLRWQPGDIYARHRLKAMVPAWVDYDLWRPLAIWQLPSAPRPLAGRPAPDALSGALWQPLANMTVADHTLTSLGNLPLTELEAWLASIDAAVLPPPPGGLPQTARDWLSQWFGHTLPGAEALDPLRIIPTPPDGPGLTQGLRIEGQ